MNRKILMAGVVSLVSLGATAAYAQEQTVPDTSVRNLEVPQDVRGKQLRAETPPSKTVLQGRSEASQPVNGTGTTTNR